MLDVDHLARVNESYGRAVGDRLLSALARRLSGMLRPGDTAARLAGDEFVLLLDGVVSEREANAVANRVEASIARPFGVDGNDLSVTLGIGIALSDTGTLAADLLGRVELAMYHSKQLGLGQRAVFHDGMHRQVVERAVRESELRRAVEHSLLPVHYQPIAELATGRIRGLEALARSPAGWPEVAPLDLILAAEETGMIGALGLHVLRTALDTLAGWRRAGLLASDVCISVNVSARQLEDPRLPAMLRAAIAGAALPPSALRLDISESALLEQPDQVQNLAAEVCKTGVGVHLDDFGTSSSSLATLHRMPIEAIKIDRTYVAALGDPDGTADAIVRSAVALAQSLGLTVIAEGIEQPLQLQRLRELGCEYGQGFLFSPPVEAEQAQLLLMGWSPSDIAAVGDGMALDNGAVPLRPHADRP
jgi:diguanylate cyclase (GGDEF)-like protein